jgi:hypothetical protein
MVIENHRSPTDHPVSDPEELGLGRDTKKYYYPTCVVPAAASEVT